MKQIVCDITMRLKTCACSRIYDMRLRTSWENGIRYTNPFKKRSFFLNETKINDQYQLTFWKLMNDPEPENGENDTLLIECLSYSFVGKCEWKLHYIFKLINV